MILGVDPSLTCTGLALIGPDGVGTTRVRTSPQEGLRGLRDRIRVAVGQTLRFAGAAGPVPLLTVIEAPVVVRGGRGGAQLERAWLYGLLVDQLLIRGEVVAVRPKVRAKYATGNGNAEKPEVLAAVRAAFPLADVPNHDVADALALAAMGARASGRPSEQLSADDDVSKKQMEAMAAVAWPVMKGARR
jgi:hypothetical protein